VLLAFPLFDLVLPLNRPVFGFVMWFFSVDFPRSGQALPFLVSFLGPQSPATNFFRTVFVELLDRRWIRSYRLFILRVQIPRPASLCQRAGSGLAAKVSFFAAPAVDLIGRVLIFFPAPRERAAGFLLRSFFARRRPRQGIFFSVRFWSRRPDFSLPHGPSAVEVHDQIPPFAQETAPLIRFSCCQSPRLQGFGSRWAPKAAGLVPAKICAGFSLGRPSLAA
jgi:hypothetical protein